MRRTSLLLIPILALAILAILSYGGTTDSGLNPTATPTECPDYTSNAEAQTGINGVERTTIPPAEEVGTQPPTPTSETEPILAQGRVVDGFEKPIAGAEISLELKSLSDEEYEDPWKTLNSFLTKADNTGSFTLRGTVNPGSYRLTVVHGGFLTASHPFNLGARGLKLRMKKPWTVSGRILIDEGLGKNYIKVWATPSFVDVTSANRNRSWIDENGKFEIENIPDGQTVFTLREGVDTEPLFSRHVLLGPEGGKLNLADIDLRGLVKRITLRLVDTDGEIPMGCWASTLDGKPLGNSIFGPVSFLTNRQEIDVKVGGQGCLTVIVDGVCEDMEIQLPPGLSVQIFVDNAPELPDEWDWYCEIAPVINDVAQPLTYSVQFFLDDVQSKIVDVPHPGPYQMRIFLADLRELQTNTGVKPKAIGTMVEMPLLEVLDQGNVQAFNYSLTRKQIEKAKAILQAASK